ncbi:winged helix-turn-helix transcriptional regulator [Gordonia rhizosphera]|uniref:Putative HxlR family transcriptional regulator n=1 Tax=Gordonia rhizosphera NBRC 16068 TaxID=1108045 RepID=K6WNF7_9ACTN|nr:helix-turn-helix domain-containing protein [Gordonia rhizosphera]GAB88079.1 putative HxlR family transcriptional regulator [Gordonia rhizosphera NBRC 16068]
MRSYGQYCPIARASEILAERWTPLVIRNLMFGAVTFTDIAHGVPLMSRSMLATRLAQLERAGVVARTPKTAGRGSEYTLTEAGRDLAGVLDELAAWGERWVEVGPEMTDPGFALWAWCIVQLDPTQLPEDRTVVAFRFPDQPVGNRTFWLLVEDGTAEVCYTDPGGEPAAEVTAESAAFIDWHRGRLGWSQALRSGRIRVTGERSVTTALPRWNLRHPVVSRTTR